jgi:hypothetical protein
MSHGSHINVDEAKERELAKQSQRKYHLPVIGHFADRSVRFESILHASRATGIHYSMIFEACIGKIYKAKNVIWEFEKGNHYIKYKAFYMNAKDTYSRPIGFNG